MNRNQVDRRVDLSRQTLRRYAEMTRAGLWPVGDLPVLEQEVAKLREICGSLDCPDVHNLMVAWGALLDALRARMN